MNVLLILLLLTNLRLLAASRMGNCIRWVGAQGVLLGVVAVAARWDALSMHVLALAVVAAALKGWAFPWLLFRAIRETQTAREVEPYLGYNLSLAAGLGALGVSFWLGRHLPVPGAGPLMVPVAFFTIFTGLLLIVTRKKAVTQVLGYLVMENGIFTFGVGALHLGSALVDLGILLDLFVAVFVMGITISHISRDFDHIDTDQMASLRG